MTLFGIGFLSPWLLAAAVVLPILWLILRAVPPAPVRRMFPGVVLLLGLKDDEQVSDRTPWWLLLLRMIALLALIIGLAGPVLNPNETSTVKNDRLLVLLDGTWAAADNWPAHQRALDSALRDAAGAGQRVAVVRLTAPEEPVFQTAEAARLALPGMAPLPWALPDEVEVTLPEGEFDTLWVSDGLDHGARAAILTEVESRGSVRVLQAARLPVALKPAEFVDGAIEVTALRVAGFADSLVVEAKGLDPAGREAVLSSGTVRFAEGDTEGTVALSLPSELRARVSRFEIQGRRSAGAVTLADDGLQRREVALIAGREDREGLELLSPLHYLENALVPNAELLSGALLDILPANPDVVVFADVATLAESETGALLDWIDQGGLLLRFAGPRVAASELSRTEEDPLMPVRLRAGGRTVGGAMSWGEPKKLAPFPMDGPFAGLDIPEDVSVSSQILAQPDPTLADRVIAQLVDGTPLVTRKRFGSGQIVLFHVSANAEWSSLPLSGLFVQMLDRLAVSTSSEALEAETLAGTTWQPVQVLDAFGVLNDAGTRSGVAGVDLVEAPIGPELLPGLYQNEEMTVARNVVGIEDVLSVAQWPASVRVEGLSVRQEIPLSGLLLAFALCLLVVDVVASLWLSGRVGGASRVAAIVMAGLLGVSGGEASAQEAQSDALALLATSEVVFGHILTGDTAVDDTAKAGLRGLSRTLFFRTSIEPDEPVGVNLETEELAFFPFLYWPIVEGQPRPSDAAYAKLNAYLRSGGMILFDTRDADVAGFGASTPEGRKLQELAASLDIPPLEPMPEDHVLTRTFYLLQDFPGRHLGRNIWVEAAPAGAEQVEGMPFRNLNDGVTPVIIGGNDWAAAWAVDQRGNPIFPVGRGYAGERQRELAHRFGVNLIMHVLTGNYKSDQVHVPALLDRLGQ